MFRVHRTKPAKAEEGKEGRDDDDSVAADTAAVSENSPEPGDVDGNGDEVRILPPSACCE